MLAAFDGGAITSDAGALLGATDRAIRMTERFAACFHDVRRHDLIEQSDLLQSTAGAEPAAVTFTLVPSGRVSIARVPG